MEDRSRHLPDRPPSVLTSMSQDWERAFRDRYEIGFAEDGRNVADILHHHALLERALDDFLAQAFVRPERLHGLGFGHKIGIWAANLRSEDEIVRPLVTMLIRFNDLRNSAVHGDPRSIVDAAHERLLDAVPPKAMLKQRSLEEATAFLLGTIAVTVDEIVTQGG